MASDQPGTITAAVQRILPSVRADLERLVRVRAREALAAHLRAHAPRGVHVTVQPGAAAAPYAAPAGGPGYWSAHAALAEAWGRPAVDIGADGSIPFVTGYAAIVPDAEILITGVEDPRRAGARRQREPASGHVRAGLPGRGAAAAQPRRPSRLGAPKPSRRPPGPGPGYCC
jgi:hypothetical protein